MRRSPRLHSRMRRSPRLHSFSSSSAQTNNSSMKKKKKKEPSRNADNSRALSLHVVDFIGQKEEEAAIPVPLKIYDPNENSLRRSTRITTNKYRSKEEEAAIPVPLKIYDPNENSLRRSTRITTNKYRTVFPERSLSEALPALPSSASRTPPRRPARLSFAETGGKSRNSLEGSKKRQRFGESHGALSGSGLKRVKVDKDLDMRRSPRLNKNLGRGKKGNSQGELLALPAPVPSHKSALKERSLSEKCLRKSPRLNPSWAGCRIGNSDGELLALPEAVSSHKTAMRECRLSENCLRKSPRLNLSTVEYRIDSFKGELLALPEPVSVAAGKSGSEKCFLSEKCLRSRTVQMHVDVGKGKEKMAKGKSEKEELSNAGEKCLRSRIIEFKMPNSSDNSALREETTSLGSDIKNVGEKSLRSRKIELQLSDASEESALRKESTSPGSDVRNVGKKCKSSSKIESELSCASIKNDLRESTSAGSEIDNVLEKRLRSRNIEFESTDASGKRSRIENNISEESDLYVGENGLAPERLEFDLPGEKSVEKRELDVLSEKCLRSRKIAFNIVVGEKDEKQHVLINGAISMKRESSTESKKSNKKESKKKSVLFFVGGPILEEEALKRWHWRYELKSRRSKHKAWILNAGEEDETILDVEFHYAQANVDGCIFDVGDCALIKGEGREKHIGRILEFFKTVEGEDYFRVQWFYKAEDTVMKEAAAFHDKKRIFYSTIENDNPLDCIISKVNVMEIQPGVGLKPDILPPINFYYDMEYCVEYSTFRNLQTGNTLKSQGSPPYQPADAFSAPITATSLEALSGYGSFKSELALLDLYSGCGGMSTGLCLGAKLSSVNLVTRWAVDIEKSACDSLKLNHPETQVRNESAKDFLELLRRWEELCKWYVFNDSEKTLEVESEDTGGSESTENSMMDKKDPAEEFEVSCLLDICYGDPNETGKHMLHFKVRWKGYGPDEDTWEPIEGLSNCQERIKDFVRNGLRSKILPLPGEVDVICGGPPCQGISGYNRYRNVDDPLTDEKNHQIVVFMDIVKFLKPKYVLMENVVDILRFDRASLGRYALSRLVHMKYQARLGTIAAGCYGLPQFRLRVFLWGALSSERLPPFPLPTHDVVVKYWPPPEFERNTVAYDEGQPRKLEDVVYLSDAISDLPAVLNNETCEEMTYNMDPATEFQKYIRSTKEEMMGLTSVQSTTTKKHVLYDHRPYPLSEDNYLRVCQVPHKKGANFRDLPGVVVGDDNVVRRDPAKEPVFLPSGEPLVPDCVFTFEKGKSKRPLARLWWDETVPTVLTFPYFLSQAILHPEQDRVLTVRECARLQGFPDYYRFCGTVKERYCQIGNGVAIPVGRALGYALGLAFQKLCGDEPLITLPPNFSFQNPVSKEIVVLGN